MASEVVLSHTAEEFSIQEFIETLEMYKDRGMTKIEFETDLNSLNIEIRVK